MPGADRIVVQKEHLGDRLAAHPIVKQQQGIGPPRQSVSHRPISGQFNQVSTRFGVKEAGADHAMTRIVVELIRKRRIRVLKESGYNADMRDYVARLLVEAGYVVEAMT